MSPPGASLDPSRPSIPIDYRVDLDRLDSAACDPDVRDLDFRVYYLLSRRLEKCPGVFPKKCDVATATGRSVSTIVRALARLAVIGMIILDTASSRGRLSSLIIFAFGPSRPRLAKSPSLDSQGYLFTPESHHPCSANADGSVESDEFTSGKSPPHSPPVLFEEEKRLTNSRACEPVSQSVFSSQDHGNPEAEVLDLIGRSLEATAHCEPFRRATDRKVLDAIAEHGVQMVEFALDRFDSQKPPIQSWGWFLGLIEKTKAANVNIEKSPVAEPTTDPRPAAPVLAIPHVPVEVYIANLILAAACSGAIGRVARTALAEGIASGEYPPELVPAELLEAPAEKKPAAGQVGKLSPPPAGAFIADFSDDARARPSMERKGIEPSTSALRTGGPRKRRGDHATTGHPVSESLAQISRERRVVNAALSLVVLNPPDYIPSCARGPTSLFSPPRSQQ